MLSTLERFLTVSRSPFIIITATQAALGLAAVHNVDKEGQASIAHTDMAGLQYVKVGDVYKLNDFNRARFITWNVKENKPCKFQVGSNPGKYRAPEEYAYEDEDEKVSRDTWNDKMQCIVVLCCTIPYLCMSLRISVSDA
jgi:hypothetical protein